MRSAFMFIDAFMAHSSASTLLWFCIHIHHAQKNTQLWIEPHHYHRHHHCHVLLVSAWKNKWSVSAAGSCVVSEIQLRQAHILLVTDSNLFIVCPKTRSTPWHIVKRTKWVHSPPKEPHDNVGISTPPRQWNLLEEVEQAQQAALGVDYIGISLHSVLNSLNRHGPGPAFIGDVGPKDRKQWNTSVER
jgi:hypothetical protein